MQDSLLSYAMLILQEDRIEVIGTKTNLIFQPKWGVLLSFVIVLK